MKLPEAIKKWLPTALITATAGSLGYFATKMVESAATPFWQHVAPAIPQKLLLSLCCFLVLAAVILTAWIVYLHRAHPETSQAAIAKQFHAQFEDAVDPATGLWKHRTKSGYFCPNCKAWLRESQMVTAEKAKEWYCPVLDCKFVILNPGMFGPGVRPVKLGPGELG